MTTQPLTTDTTVASSSAEERTPGRILAVDDSPTNLFLARTMLEDRGVRIDEATTGADAVKLARSHDYCAVLMDLVLPQGSGIWAAREIRKLAGSRGHVPILAITANSIDLERDACIAAGINDILAKPIDKAVLDRALDRWCAPSKVVTTDPSATIDRNAFGLLRRSVTPTSLAFLINRFVTETTVRVGHLRAAATRNDHDLVLREAHSLKGAAMLFGAEALSHSAARIEGLAASGRIEMDKIEETVALATAACQWLRGASQAEPSRDAGQATVNG